MARDLFGNGILTNDWREHGVAIAHNEYEQHALRDFCSEVYDAWSRFQVPIGMARKA